MCFTKTFLDLNFMYFAYSIQCAHQQRKKACILCPGTMKRALRLCLERTLAPGPFLAFKTCQSDLVPLLLFLFR